MNKFEQITKLAEAAELIRAVAQHADPDYVDQLDDICVELADIADQIEGFEQ